MDGLASHTLLPRSWPPSAAALGSSFLAVFSCTVLACLEVENPFKTFPFHDHSDFGEEPEVTQPVNKVTEVTVLSIGICRMVPAAIVNGFPTKQCKTLRKEDCETAAERARPRA